MHAKSRSPPATRRATTCGGLTIGLSALAVALMQARFAGASSRLAAAAIYPLSHGADRRRAHVLCSGFIGGWLMALVAWMVSASRWTSGQILVTWLLPAVLGNLAGGVAIVSRLNYGQVRVGGGWRRAAR